MTRWKVCGMQDKENVREVAALFPDFMGFIFYPPSPRHAPLGLCASDVRSLPREIVRVGVFVEASAEEVLSVVGEYGLHAAQLHGATPEVVHELDRRGIMTICVFSVSDALDADAVQSFCDASFFLFDTRREGFKGGTGQPFDRQIVFDMALDKPYFMSGGIDMDEVPSLKGKMFGIDVNSKFEVRPGLKDVKKLSLLAKALL